MEIISRKEAIEEGLKTYFTGKPCKYGHVTERRVDNKTCLECSKERNKEYRERNKEHLKEYFKEYYEQNKEYFKGYWEQNKEHKKEYYRSRYASDENYKASVICRNMLQRTLKATNSTKDTRTYEMLGYCNEQLEDSIESKFLEGMSWDNYGDWHIDHICPVTRYIKDRVEDPAIINALDNLIPMWSEHNLEKGDRTLEEYLDDRKDLVELYGRFL